MRVKLCAACLDKLNLERSWTTPFAAARCWLCGQLQGCAEVPDSAVIADVPEAREPHLGPPLQGEP